MFKTRRVLHLSLLTIGLSGLAGCGNDPDKTGTGDTGFGPPGVNAADAPQTPEQQYELQKKEEAEAQKRYRSGK